MNCTYLKLCFYVMNVKYQVFQVLVLQFISQKVFEVYLYFFLYKSINNQVSNSFTRIMLIYIEATHSKLNALLKINNYHYLTITTKNFPAKSRSNLSPILPLTSLFLESFQNGCEPNKLQPVSVDISIIINFCGVHVRTLTTFFIFFISSLSSSLASVVLCFLRLATCKMSFHDEMSVP